MKHESIGTMDRDSVKAIVQAGLDLENNLMLIEKAAQTEKNALVVLNDAHAALAEAMAQFVDICYDYCESFPEGVWLLNIRGLPTLYAAGVVCGLVGLTLRRLSYVYRLCGLDPGAKEYSAKDAREFWAEHVSDPRHATIEEVRAISVKTGRALEPGWRDREERGQTLTKDEVFRWILKRPHSEFLRVLLLQIRKALSEADGPYRDLYLELLDLEKKRNEAGEFKGEAQKSLASSKDRRWQDYHFYAKGLLPPTHIEERSKRAMVKQFLADLYDRIDPVFKDER